MSLEIQQRESEGIVILDLRGILALGEGDSELRAKLLAATQPDQVNVILNLKEVSQIDSTGVDTLVSGLNRLQMDGGRLALVNVDKSRLELSLLTRLALAFEFFDDEHDAVNSFFPDRAVKEFDVLTFVERQRDDPGNTPGPTEATC
jgi:anti-sigma B factor antagonist